MAVEEFISTRALPKYLKQEIEARLIDHEVYDIGNYGWIDGDTPDPKFLGHAMWQLESPLLNDMLNLAFPDVPVIHRPTPDDEVVAVAGSDFEGHIRLARMSLGLALWQQHLAEEAVFDDNDYFWLHYASAMVMLNVASDRIREFFVMAYFRETLDTYQKKKRRGMNSKYYQTPFIEASALEAMGSGDKVIENLLGRLEPLAQEIYRNRNDRNTMVHEISTVIGTRKAKLTQKLRKRFDEQQASSPARNTRDSGDPAARFKETRDQHASQLCKATNQIVSWYKTLIQTSSLVFELEYRIRARHVTVPKAQV